MDWAKIEPHRGAIHWLCSSMQTRPLIIHLHVGQGAAVLGEKLLLWTNEHSFAIFSCHLFGAKSLKNIPEIMNILTSASICWVVGIRRRDVLMDGCFNLDVWGLVPNVSVLEQWKHEWKAHCEVGYWGLHPWEGWMLVLNSRVGCYKETMCLAFSAPLPYCGSPVGSLEVEHVRPPDLGLSTPKIVSKISLFPYKITSIMCLLVQHKWTNTVVKSMSSNQMKVNWVWLLLFEQITFV